jgi:lipoprotein-releasing system permease protein
MGVAALLIVLSVMNGFNLTIRGRMLNFEPHLVVTMPSRPSGKQLADLFHKLNEVTPVERIDRFEAQDLILRTQDGAFGGAIAKGYDHMALSALLERAGRVTHRHGEKPNGSEGDLLSDEDDGDPLKPNEVILGADLARNLGVFEGDEILLVPPETLLLPKGEVPKLQKFKIKSLVNTQVPDVDSKLLFYELNEKASRNKVLSLDTGFELRLEDPYKADRLKARLTELGFKTQTWAERDTSLFYSLKMESFLMALFLTLAVLITSFSIVTVMILLMNQKRKDIGLLQAMGLSLVRTRRVFFRVGLLLSSVGILGGVVVGTSVSLILDRYPLEILPDVYTDTTLPAKLTWGIFFFVLGASAFIAIVGSWLPVKRYVLKHPSDSLRKPIGAMD